MKINDNLKYAISGAAAGAANGFFGAGGGMFLVPLLCRFAKMPQRRALATSLAVIMPVSIVSSIIYIMKQSVSFAEAVPFLVGGFVGGLLGGVIFKKISAEFLRRALAVFIIYGGIRALFLV